LIKARDIINSIDESAPFTDEQKKTDQLVTNYLIEAIRTVTGKDKWDIRVNSQPMYNSSGSVIGSWVKIYRTPPRVVPNLYEMIDFKFSFDFSSPCYLYYAYGRGGGEFKSKTFKTSMVSVRQNLVTVFKSLYLDNFSVPNLDKVIDIKKLQG
jgi:hypothetical protein